MRHSGSRVLAWATVLCCLGAKEAAAGSDPADLTDLSFDSLSTMQVSTASRFAQSTREAPSAVMVLLREDIRRHGWRSLIEALSSLPGMYSVNDGAYDFAGARGFLVPGDYNTRFLLLIDGQRLNDNIYQQALLGEEFPLDLTLVERIEYVPGPGSSIYGGNAIFGVINIITRKAAELPPLSLSATASSQKQQAASITGSHRLSSGAAIMASVSTERWHSKDQTYNDPVGGLIQADGLPSPDGVAHDLDELNNTRLFIRYEDGGLTLSGRYGKRMVQPSSGLYNTLFNDPDTEVIDNNWSLLARYESQLNGHLNLESRLELAQTTYEATLPYLDDTGARYLNHDESLGRWWAADIRLLHTGWTSHKLIGGIDAQVDQQSRQQNYDLNLAVPVNAVVDISSPERRTGIYLQDEWRLAERWRLNAGVRHDRYSDSGSATSPRLGLIWLASPAQTLKLLAGKAYRPANAYERYYSNDLNYIGNPALEPETIKTLEAVFEQKLGQTQQLSLSAYRYELNKLIVQQTLDNGGLQYQNQSRINAHGAELVWQLRRESGTTLSASIATGRAEDDQGQRLNYSPRWIAKLRGSVPIPHTRWQMAAETSCISTTPFSWQDVEYQQKARVLVNLSLSPAIAKPGLDGYLRIVNLFNRTYEQPASDEIPVPTVPGKERAIEAGLRYAF